MYVINLKLEHQTENERRGSASPFRLNSDYNESGLHQIDPRLPYLRPRRGKRNDSYSKLIYHSDEISALWTEIEREYSVDEAEVISASEQAIEIISNTYSIYLLGLIRVFYYWYSLFIIHFS